MLLFRVAERKRNIVQYISSLNHQTPVSVVKLYSGQALLSPQLYLCQKQCHVAGFGILLVISINQSNGRVF